MIEFVPQKLEVPPRCLTGDFGTSAWIGLESILGEVVERFCRKRGVALEFGVEHGYSAVALSNFFERVIAVDPFGQRTATEPIEPMIARCQRNISPYDNISLLPVPWQHFTSIAPVPPGGYDLVHVDAEHGYYDTYGPGNFGCLHSAVVIFHDIDSFPDTVLPAVQNLAIKHGMTFYAYHKHHGLGILARE
jgi:predicted O-methyltransferase YrrM